MPPFWLWISGLSECNAVYKFVLVNDAARFSLIRGSCSSVVAVRLMEYHLRREADNNLSIWFARVPTEANVSDYPSRGLSHNMLDSGLDESVAASAWFVNMVRSLQAGQAD